jgi:hypothetical protein
VHQFFNIFFTVDPVFVFKCLVMVWSISFLVLLGFVQVEFAYAFLSIGRSAIPRITVLRFRRKLVHDDVHVS